MNIKRDSYIEELRKSIGNGMIKVITGPRRSGKSYLLDPLFTDWLLEHGIPKERIFRIDLSDDTSAVLRNPIRLGERLRTILPKDGPAFLFLDEIQNCEPVENPAFQGLKTADGSKPVITFYDVLNGLLSSHKEVEVFVTGSNSHLLSSDIATEFRGRDWQIPMHPLTYAEFLSAHEGEGDDLDLWQQYYLYGGLPRVSTISDIPGKRNYLQSVFSTTYLKDIVDRYSLRGEASLEMLTRYLASVVGSSVNPANISNALRSKESFRIAPETIKNYIDHLKDAFLLSEAERYNLRGKERLGASSKYYFEDLGLRNAATNFTDCDQEPHYMENVIYNELISRRYKVSVGNIASYSQANGKTERRNYEIDFVADDGGRKVYIQSALYIQDKDKMDQERKPLLLLGGGFKKVLITKISGTGLYDEDGILHLNLFRFLKDRNSLKDR